MSKFYGVIGFANQVEERPGIWEEEFTERTYSGDLKRNTRRLQTSDQVNDDIVISNEISIIADPYATQNFHTMRYAVFMGVKWKITSVDVQFPRLVLTLGGVYNENKIGTSNHA